MQPTTEELRELAGWEPPLGVISVYLSFDPADRTGTWRIELRNGLERIREEADGAEHERRVAVRATAGRLLERFDQNGETRPPPRGEAGFAEVAENAGGERWWPTGVGPDEATVRLEPRPLVAPLVDVAERGVPHGVAVISSERVRLLRFADARIEELENWEMSYFELDWREQEGPDRYEHRLEHNRKRFLAEAGKLAGERLRDRGIADALVIGPAGDWTEFEKGIQQTEVRGESSDRADLITVPVGELLPGVTEAVERAKDERDRAVLERALGEGGGERPGALGRQDTSEALAEGRVEHLVFDAAIGEAAAEQLVCQALATSAGVTIVRGELAEKLASAEGVAAVLRY